jgi:hypothetical protein
MERKLFALVLGALALTLMAFVGQMDSFFVYLPIVSRDPTPTPTSTPTATVTPTATTGPTPIPCPGFNPTPATTYFSNGGVQGQFFRLKEGQSNCAQRNQDVWFYFEARNTTGQPYDVGGLGARWCTTTAYQCTQASWGDFLWTHPYAGTVIGHEDHLNIPNSGTYQVRLAICWLSTRDECMANPAAWHDLSGPITLVIQ